MNKLLSNDFVLKMEEELINNQHKGIWEEWKPNETTLKNEINHHIQKLYSAIDSNNKKLIQEYSADVANLCEKAFTCFGKI